MTPTPRYRAGKPAYTPAGGEPFYTFPRANVRCPVCGGVFTAALFADGDRVCGMCRVQQQVSAGGEVLRSIQRRSGKR